MRSREDAPDLTDGGIAYNLRRAVAERAESARDAVHLLMVLVRRWGYASPGRAYTVADADEAFMIQIVHGKHYAGAARAGRRRGRHAQPLYDPTARRRSRSTGPLRDSKAMRAARGWCAPDEPFDFARAYQHPDSRMQPVNVLRPALQRRGADRQTVSGGGNAVRRASRGAGDGGEADGDARQSLRGARRKTCALAREGRRTAASIPASATAAPWSRPWFDLYHNPRLTTVWLAAGRPCQQPWLPLHPLCGLPDALAPMAGSCGGAGAPPVPGSVAHGARQ